MVFTTISIYKTFRKELLTSSQKRDIEKYVEISNDMVKAKTTLQTTLKTGGFFSEDMGDVIRTLGAIELEVIGGEDDGKIIDLPFLFDVDMRKGNIVKETSEHIFTQFEKDDIIFTVDYISEERSIAYISKMFNNEIPILKGKFDRQFKDTINEMRNDSQLVFYSIIWSELYRDSSNLQKPARLTQNLPIDYSAEGNKATQVKIRDLVHLRGDLLRGIAAGDIKKATSRSVSRENNKVKMDTLTNIVFGVGK
jgi:hypothetical protein